MSGPDEPAMFSNEWRAARVRAGDEALKLAEGEPAAYKSHMYTAMALAHYAAANVRAKVDNPAYLAEQAEIQKAQEGK